MYCLHNMAAVNLNLKCKFTPPFFPSYVLTFELGLVLYLGVIWGIYALDRRKLGVLKGIGRVLLTAQVLNIEF